METPSKHSLKRKVGWLTVQLHQEREKKTNNKGLRLKSAIACIKQYLPSQIKSFIESQVQMLQRSKYAYRWKVKDKMLALSILFHSRKAYKILSCFFILPSIRTLQHDLQKMSIKPGFSESVLEALKVKVNAMDCKDKNVVLIFDEMGIKEGLLYNVGRDVIKGFEAFWLYWPSKVYCKPCYSPYD